MTCARCAESTPRLRLDQRYCPRCEREVATLTRPRPVPSWTPLWRRVAAAKDLTPH
jgi:hypothetical protein